MNLPTWILLGESSCLDLSSWILPRQSSCMNTPFIEQSSQSVILGKYNFVYEFWTILFVWLLRIHSKSGYTTVISQWLQGEVSLWRTQRSLKEPKETQKLTLWALRVSNSSLWNVIPLLKALLILWDQCRSDLVEFCSRRENNICPREECERVKDRILLPLSPTNSLFGLLAHSEARTRENCILGLSASKAATDRSGNQALAVQAFERHLHSTQKFRESEVPRVWTLCISRIMGIAREERWNFVPSERALQTQLTKQEPISASFTSLEKCVAERVLLETREDPAGTEWCWNWVEL